MNEHNDTTKIFSLEALCGLTGLSKRTIRYYIQIGLVPRPVGESRGAHYTVEHLEIMLRIIRLTKAGLSLEGVRAVLQGGEAPQMRSRSPGTVEVRSHFFIAPGIEVQVFPEEAEFNPEQLRAFIRLTLEAVSSIKGEQAGKHTTDQTRSGHADGNDENQ